MPSTTNFGWTTPADTDLVKDGASAIRTLGNGIDASFVDLKGGTTGQVLSKASNTDLDFTWIANDQGDITAVTAGTGLTGGGTTGAVTLTNDMATTITASGDIVVGTGSGTYDNLPIGTTGQVLTADTTVSPYKVKWATVGGTDYDYQLLNTGGTALTGAATVTVTGISNKQFLYIFVQDASSATAASTITIRLNTDTGNNYTWHGIYVEGGTPGASGGNAQNYIPLGRMGTSAGNTVQSTILIFGCNAAGRKPIAFAGYGTGTSPVAYSGTGAYDGTSAITSVSIFSTSGNLDGGTVYVYGA